MLAKSLLYFFALPVAIRAAVQNTTASSAACNNSPLLCSRGYDQVTHLGAHDSPFIRDASTDYSTSGNQYYNSTVQLSSGVRLLTAQVQVPSNDSGLHVCHSSCDLLDAGPLSEWLREVRTWIQSNPNEVVTVLLVNGADASASDLDAQYSAAGITTDLAYTPSGSSAGSQQWPTLQSLINSGTRMINFVPSLNDNTAAPYLMNEWDYIFENPYEVTSPSTFSCEAFRPSDASGYTSQAISKGMMPFMNHFLYQSSEGSFISIESPNASYVGTTNAPNGGLGNLGTAASTCKQYYGRNPSFILVDFFNVGPAMETVDRLNGVTDPVSRKRISAANHAPDSAGARLPVPMSWGSWSVGLTCFLALAML